jgi:type IV pilus assembly protein PilV
MESEQGFTLIEVLITFLIIAIGLLGLGALQVNTMNDQFEANQRAYATWLVDDMASRIRANAPDAVSGSYLDTANVALPSVCRAAANTIVQRDLCLWNALLSGTHAKEFGVDGDAVGSALNAVGCIELGPTGSDGNSIRVTVAWQGVKSSVPPEVACGGPDATTGASPFGDDAFRRAVFRDVFLR